MPKSRDTCPGCESEQAFPLRTRPTPASDVVIQVYISCTLCPFELALRYSTHEIEKLRRQRARLREVGRRQEARSGSMYASTMRALDKLDVEIWSKEKELRERAS